MNKLIAYSMAVLEVNASMGVIVAAPTAGSSGVVPGVLLALQEEKRIQRRTDDGCIVSYSGHRLSADAGMPLWQVRRQAVRQR